MKIIALYGVLQDRLNLNFLKISIKSLYNSVDEIIVLFDTPNDQKKIKKELFLKKKKNFNILFKKKIKKNQFTCYRIVENWKKSRRITFYIFGCR